FTFEKIENEFGVIQQTKKIFVNSYPDIPPSAWLLETLSRSANIPLTTEKAVSEAIVFPILQESMYNNTDKAQLFSGEILDSDKKRRLYGECDYIISLSPQSREVRSPILSVLEAKKADIESPKNQAQNAAQLLGARVFNEQRGRQVPLLFGACTNGFDWAFLMLQNQTIYVDIDRYSIQNLPKLLGTIDWIIKSSAAAIA
nr:hypothetical protein [Spirosomataceae bacterium]